MWNWITKRTRVTLLLVGRNVILSEKLIISPVGDCCWSQYDSKGPIISLFSSLLCTPLSSPFTLFTHSPLTPLTHLYQRTIFSNICLFFYCSDLSLVPFFHKLLLTQHKARGRRRSPSQKQAHPDTFNTGTNTDFRIRPLPRWSCFLSLPP